MLKKRIKKKVITFPARIINNINSIIILLDISNTIYQTCTSCNEKYDLIVFDLTHTRCFETNLLVIINDMVSFVQENQYYMEMLLQTYRGDICIIKRNFILELYKRFSLNDRKNDLLCKCIDVTSPHRIDRILNYNLRRYAIPQSKLIISTISELFSNVFMHSNSPYCDFGGYIRDDNTLILSVFNRGLPIKDKLAFQKMEFSTSNEAILWALKKSYTTRENTPGGLGLYFLRKNLHEIHAKFHIVSEYAYLYLKKDFYYIEDENRIIVPEQKKLIDYILLNIAQQMVSEENVNIIMPEKLSGNLFILEIPLEKEKQAENDVRVDYNLINLWR